MVREAIGSRKNSAGFSRLLAPYSIAPKLLP
jgi:hypothetical protein